MARGKGEITNEQKDEIYNECVKWPEYIPLEFYKEDAENWPSKYVLVSDFPPIIF